MGNVKVWSAQDKRDMAAKLNDFDPQEQTHSVCTYQSDGGWAYDKELNLKVRQMLLQSADRDDEIVKLRTESRWAKDEADARSEAVKNLEARVSTLKARIAELELYKKRVEEDIRAAHSETGKARSDLEDVVIERDDIKAKMESVAKECEEVLTAVKGCITRECTNDCDLAEECANDHVGCLCEKKIDDLLTHIREARGEVKK